MIQFAQMKQTHKERVAALAAQVAGFYEQKKPFKIYHGSTNSTRIQVFKRSEMLDASGLNHILHIDPKTKTALVEPNVPMDKLVRATLKHGLIPPVVMEFPGITVGGGVQGGAGESSSFRYGCFHSTCTSYEIITGDGTIRNCSPKKHADLFYGTAGSYGTLGVMTAIELRLIPAKKYVRLTYFPVKSFVAAVPLMQKEAAKKPDYIDGIMFARDRGVIMVGSLTNEKAGVVTRFSRARDEWFYLDAEKESHGGVWNKIIPLTDYLFRYDRGAFWVGKYAFKVFDIPFTKFWRRLLNWMLHTRKLYEALQESGMSQHHVVQDLALPVEKAVEFMNFVDNTLGIYPLWLCPLKTDKLSPFISSNLPTPLVINVGVWGEFIPDYNEFLRANRSIEKKLTQLGGKKWFYAHAYYSEEDFWHIYDKNKYQKLRRTYQTSYQPTVYEKVRVRERFKLDTHRGLWRTLFRTAKLRITP